MSLGDVKHQGFAHRLIQRAVSGRRVPHAYLFHGPDGVGKEKLAVGLAELLLCGKPVLSEAKSRVLHAPSSQARVENANAKTIRHEKFRVGCGRCEDCRAVAAQTHPDLHLVYRQLNRVHPDPAVRKRKALDIGVDILRRFVIAKVGLTPARGRAKVFVVREADRITPQAQNALLKTLEEPPGATVIILLVTALDRLLPTTLSRCQVVRFDALPTGFVHASLTTLLPDVPPEQVEWYARCSDGSLGRAMQFAQDNMYELNQQLLEGFASLSATGARKVRTADPPPEPRASARAKTPAPGGSTPRHELAKTWTDEAKSLGERYRKADPDITETEAGRRGLKSVFQLAATWYADILRFGVWHAQVPAERGAGMSNPDIADIKHGGAALGHATPLVNMHWSPQIERAAGSMKPQQAIEAVNRIVRAERHLDLNANTQLCIEALLNDLAR